MRIESLNYMYICIYSSVFLISMIMSNINNMNINKYKQTSSITLYYTYTNIQALHFAGSNHGSEY